MSAKVSFHVEPRTLEGKKVKTLIKQSLIPAVINGEVEHSVLISVKSVDFAHLYHKVGDTGLVYVQVEGEKSERPVLVADVQHDPLSDRVLHVVFRQVNLNEKVSAEVPVLIVGELSVKNAVVVTVHDAIMVEALPQDLPEKFEIDISTLTAIGQMVTFEQLNFDKSKITLDVPTEQLDTPVVMIQELKEEVAEVAAPVAEAAAAPAEATPAATAPTADKKAAK